MIEKNHIDDIQIIRKLVGNISVQELFSDQFMQEYTKLLNFNLFMDIIGKLLHTIEDIPSIKGAQTDDLVSQYTEFGTWPEMVFTACNYYLVMHTS